MTKKSTNADRNRRIRKIAKLLHEVAFLYLGRSPGIASVVVDKREAWVAYAPGEVALPKKYGLTHLTPTGATFGAIGVKLTIVAPDEAILF